MRIQTCNATQLARQTIKSGLNAPEARQLLQSSPDIASARSRHLWHVCAILVFGLILQGLSIPASAQLACKQWRITDNGTDTGYRASLQSDINYWVSQKNNGAQVTGCGPLGRLWNIQNVAPTGSYPYPGGATLNANLSPSPGSPYLLSCSLWAIQTCPPLYYVQATALLLSDCLSCNMLGDPINPATGNVHVVESDITPANSTAPVAFQRFFNSLDSNSTDLGPGWRHTYSGAITTKYLTVPYQLYPGTPIASPLYSDEPTACTSGFAAIQSQVSNWASATATYSSGICILKIGSVVIGTLQILFADQYPPDPLPTIIGYEAVRDDGQRVEFTVQGGVIVAPPGSSLRLQVTGSQLTLTDENDTAEVYASNGQLQSITSRQGITQTLTYDGTGRLSSVADNFGHQIALAYDSQNRLSTVTAPDSNVIQYAYDTSGRLASATNTDLAVRSYVYENASRPTALTGIIDENSVRYSTWGYDAQGRGTSSSEAGGAGAVSLVYNAGGTLTATDALGAVRTFTFGRFGDRNLVTSISGSQCPTCEDAAATTYDTGAWVSSRTDYNGNLTCYNNDFPRGLVACNNHS